MFLYVSFQNLLPLLVSVVDAQLGLLEVVLCFLDLGQELGLAGVEGLALLFLFSLGLQS